MYFAQEPLFPKDSLPIDGLLLIVAMKVLMDMEDEAYKNNSFGKGFEVLNEVPY